MLDNVIPPSLVAAVEDEVRRDTERPLDPPGAAGDAHSATVKNDVHNSANDRDGRINPLARMPLFREWLAHPVVLDVARQMLDDHVRLAQINYRLIKGDDEDGTPGGVPWVKDRTPLRREWHTDWPHDLNAYGGDNAEQNAGAIRQPFPDVCMCLSMVWYLSETGPEAGGTWAVPGSHRDPRNPRGPADGINVAAPIPGELQCSAPPGSVFIQDTRTWHSSACWGRMPRTAMVTRYAPWWLSVSEFGKVPSGYMPKEQYDECSAELQPLLAHLCDEVPSNSLQEPVLQRAAASSARTAWGFAQAEADADNVHMANFDMSPVGAKL